MEAVVHQNTVSADHVIQDLRDYVQRVSTLFTLYGAPEAEHALHINLATLALTPTSPCPMSWSGRSTPACRCGPKWKTQLVEARHADPRSAVVSVVRDVSYRFRVNGRDPINGKQAFDSRLERLRRILLTDTEIPSSSAFQRRRSLAQVIFLWLVLNPTLNHATLDEHAPGLAAGSPGNMVRPRCLPT